MRLPSQWAVPKGIAVSDHAGEKYLKRVLGMPDDDPSLIWAARHVLRLNLEGRVWPVENLVPGVFRVRLAAPGARIVYQPAAKKVVTVVPGKGSGFGLTIPAPPDLLVDKKTLKALRVSWGRLIREKWPAVRGGSSWVEITVDGRAAVLDLRRWRLTVLEIKK